MTVDGVSAVVGNTPSMSREQGERISHFIAERGVKSILELGFQHGVSTCYMAAALSRQGGGSIVTIDVTGARNLEPNIEALLQRIG